MSADVLLNEKALDAAIIVGSNMAGEDLVRDIVTEYLTVARAAMPGVEEIARALRPAVWARCDAAGVTGTSTGSGITIGDLSARRSSLEDARAILDLFAPILAEKDEHTAMLQAIVSDSLWSKRQALEARALAAEAALAAERERCAKIAEDKAHTLDFRARAAIAAAIRAQG